MVAAVACKYDDGELWDKVNSLDDRLTSIETQLSKMNSDINSISTIVNALQNKVYVTSVDEVENGYQITFTDGKTVTITNGKDGADAPVISVDEFEGKYYWVQIIGETKSWLTDKNGAKIPVTGDDGITPILKVNTEGYWVISYDRGITFELLLDETNNPVKAVGKDGADGQDGVNGSNGADGDSFFSDVRVENGELVLVLVDGTELRLPLSDDFEGSPFTLVMNVDDPEILMLQVDEENLVHYYGEKNEDGSAKAIQKIVVENSVTGNTIIDVDEAMRPTYIMTYTGVTYDIKWDSETTGVINAFEPNSNTMVCVSFDTKEETGVPESQIPVQSKSVARSGRLEYAVTPLKSSFNDEYPVLSRGANENNQQCLVTFEKCDDYYDPTSVYLTMVSEKGGSWLGELHFYEKVDVGKYLFHIPSDKYPAIDTKQIVKAVNDVFSVVGFVSECLVATGGDYVLCAAVSAGLTLLSEGAFALAAPGFTAGCTAAIKGLAAAALVNGIGINGVPAFGADDTPTLSNTVIKMLDNANLLKKVYTDNIVLGPIVNGTASANNELYPHVTITPEDNSKIIPIVSEGTPILQRFHLDPWEPVEGQSYVAYATVHCMPVGTTVKMSIVGTDGYKDEQTTTLTSANDVVALHVPGAEQGVRDLVEVWIEDAEGNYISHQSASLYFH